MQTTCAVLTPRAVWCRARAPAGLSKLSQLLALSAWHLIAQGRSESSSDKQISALRIEVSDQSPTGARCPSWRPLPLAAPYFHWQSTADCAGLPV